MPRIAALLFGTLVLAGCGKLVGFTTCDGECSPPPGGDRRDRRGDQRVQNRGDDSALADGGAFQGDPGGDDATPSGDSTPPTGDTNSAGDSNSAGDTNSAGDSNSAGDINSAGDSNSAGDTNTGGDDTLPPGDTTTSWPPGAGCIDDGQCASGQCLGNYCCPSPDCDSQCQTCTGQGTCIDVAGTCDSGSGECAGGRCKKKTGQQCDGPDDCATGNCIECLAWSGCAGPKICCEQACGLCYSCDPTGKGCLTREPGDPCAPIDCSDEAWGWETADPPYVRCYAKTREYRGTCDWDYERNRMACVDADCSYALRGTDFIECDISCSEFDSCNYGELLSLSQCTPGCPP